MTTVPNEHQARINACTSLQELCDTLNALDAELKAANPDADYRIEIADFIDLANLPTFGGTEPSNTDGIWSWDAKEQIEVGGRSNNEFEVVRRND